MRYESAGYRYLPLWRRVPLVQWILLIQYTSMCTMKSSPPAFTSSMCTAVSATHHAHKVLALQTSPPAQNALLNSDEAMFCSSYSGCAAIIWEEGRRAMNLRRNLCRLTLRALSPPSYLRQAHHLGPLPFSPRGALLAHPILLPRVGLVRWVQGMAVGGVQRRGQPA